jgi:hypothetical protein
MREPLQSYLDLLTAEQRRTMAAMLREIAGNERVPQAERNDAAARAAELDPSGGAAGHSAAATRRKRRMGARP